MAHFNFVISQNAKWGHAGFYIDCHRMTVPENILLQKKHCRKDCYVPDHFVRCKIHRHIIITGTAHKRRKFLKERRAAGVSCA